jgi:hypothetical protein
MAAHEGVVFRELLRISATSSYVLVGQRSQIFLKYKRVSNLQV